MIMISIITTLKPNVQNVKKTKRYKSQHNHANADELCIIEGPEFEFSHLVKPFCLRGKH